VFFLAGDLKANHKRTKEKNSQNSVSSYFRAFPIFF
jgi:hypothetical protein